MWKRVLKNKKSFLLFFHECNAVIWKILKIQIKFYFISLIKRAHDLHHRPLLCKIEISEIWIEKDIYIYRYKNKKIQNKKISIVSRNAQRIKICLENKNNNNKNTHKDKNETQICDKIGKNPLSKFDSCHTFESG